MSLEYTVRKPYGYLVIELERIAKVCQHLKRVRYLFRNEYYEFLRCEGCGQIVRLPV